jgi:hypothetical protein
MASTYVSATAGAGTTLAMPTHQAGDLLVMFAYPGTGAVPATPAGWVARQEASLSLRSGTVAWKTATSNSETSGTWNNAVLLACAVYRSDVGLYLMAGGLGMTAGNNAAFLRYAAVTVTNTVRSGAARFVGMAGTTTDDVANTAPSGMTNRTSLATADGEIAIHDTNSGTGTDWSNVDIATTSVVYRSFVLEVFETDIPISSGGAAFQLVGGGGGLVY